MRSEIIAIGLVLGTLVAVPAFAAEAQALRASFDAATAKVNAEVAKAIADGTVTKEEAQAVRSAGPHRGGDHCEGKDKKS